jgi:hypothetical protein
LLGIQGFATAGDGVMQMVVGELAPGESPPDPIKLLQEWQALQAAAPRSPVQSASDVYVDGQATVFITLQDPSMPQEPIDGLAAKAVKCVADIIPRFEPFF